MNRTMTLDMEKALKELAANLPDSLYVSDGQSSITGKDAKLTGLKGPFVDDAIYYYQSPTFHECNHYRRLKKAYQKHGLQGVANYVKPLTN